MMITAVKCYVLKDILLAPRYYKVSNCGRFARKLIGAKVFVRTYVDSPDLHTTLYNKMNLLLRDVILVHLI